MDETTQRILALLVVTGIGLAVGRLQWRGISLGSAGVLFVALIAGQFGFEVPGIAGVAGVVLFVYCLGIGAGHSFFRSLLQNGKQLAALGAVMIVSAAATTWIVAKTLGLAADLAIGLFAGALTSTPALAAATQRLPPDSDVTVGFGVAYPVGVVGVIVFVQLAPRLFRRPLDTGESAGADVSHSDAITRVLVEVLNPAVVGRRLREVGTLSRGNCQISRLLVGETLTPIRADFTLQLGQRLLVIGHASRIQDVVDALGKRCDEVAYVLDTERQRRRVVVTSKELVGSSLEQLHLLSRFGVTIVRIHRHDIEFVPGPDEKLQFGDALTAVGEAEALLQFTQYAGHRERTIDETDLISLVVGLALGVVLGQVRFNLGNQSLALGMAGGPLLVGLLLGHFGRIGPVAGYIPRAARFLLSEIGLALFLAHAGAQAGSQLLPVVRQHGPALLGGSLLILLVPLVVGCLLARFTLRMNALQMLGGMCGAMTSTPALGVISSSVDSNLPTTSYATVYPLALILVTLMAPLLIGLLQ
jgi:putative transport protein